MTAEELARKVRLIELRARRLVAGMISGAYHSAFKGQGVEFQEVREYVPGDDTRAIDWNVTARVGRPYLKRYAEERDQTVVILLDASRSHLLGAKKDAAAEIFAVLAFAALSNKDEASLILFTGDVELYVPPRRGPRHVLRLIREVVAHEPRGSGTSLARALEFLCQVRRRRSLVFVISDFQDAGFEHELRIAARFHEVVAFSIYDPREAALPDCGLMDFADPETGARWTLDTSDAAVRKAWSEGSRQQATAANAALRGAGVDHLRLETGGDSVRRMVPFLHRRAMERRYAE